MSGAPASTRPVVLIVDDSKMIRVSLRKVLEGEFELLDAADGNEAFQLLCTDDRIQVVVTDAGMPNMDGYELAACVRSHGNDRIRRVPIIMVTAAEEAAARDRALEAGATDFILKPFDKAELLARVRAHANFDRTARALAEQATQDPVTGLPSKRFLLQRGAQDLAFAKRHGSDLTMLRLCIDGFAGIAASRDQAQVNQLLAQLATILQNNVRKEDTVAHLETGQFAILAPTVGAAEADALCRRIREQAASHDFQLPSLLTMSMGLVFLHEAELTSLETGLQRAEHRMQQAQQAGGNRIIGAAAAGHTSAVSLDAALKLLQKGEADKLKPYVRGILQRVLPLLEYCDKTADLGLAPLIAALRAKTGGV